MLARFWMRLNDSSSCSVASEQNKTNAELEKKLEVTERARAEAMRKLSDMNQS